MDYSACVVIPTIGRDTIFKCLNHIKNSLCNLSVKVFVVDSSKESIPCDKFSEYDFVEVIRNETCDTSVPSGRQIGMMKALEEGYDFCFFTDDDCYVCDRALLRIYEVISNKENVAFPYIASLGNYNCFLRIPKEKINSVFIPSISCDVLFCVNLPFIKQNKIFWDIKGGNRCSADFCLQIIKAGGTTGMIEAKVVHRTSSEGTKNKTEDNYFRFSRYIQNKHCDVLKLSKNSRFLFNKPDRMKIKYIIDDKNRILPVY